MCDTVTIVTVSALPDLSQPAKTVAASSSLVSGPCVVPHQIVKNKRRQPKSLIGGLA